MKRLAAWALLAVVTMPTAARATYPGFNGKIAYTDLVDPNAYNRAVFVDKHQFSFPGPGSSDAEPAWSPDGKHIAWVRSSANEREIWVADDSGANLHMAFRTGGTHAVDPPDLFANKSVGSLNWAQDNVGIFFATWDPVVSGYQTWRVNDTAGSDAGTLAIEAFQDFNSPPSFDTGQYGDVSPNILPPASLCFGGRCNSLVLPDGSLLYPATDYRNRPVWWPQNNQRKVAVLSSSKIYGVEYDANYKVKEIRQLTPDSGTVTCTGHNENGRAMSLTELENAFEEPVPSPDGKIILAYRTKVGAPLNDLPLPGVDPQPVPLGGCSFSMTFGLVKVDQKSGQASPYLDSSTAAEAAWQPMPGNLVVTVTDDHQNPLDGIQIELRDPNSDPNQPDPKALGPARQMEGGLYGFDDVKPGEYLVRVTLKNVEWNAFDVRHDDGASAPEWVERSVTIGDQQVRLSFSFSEDDVTNSSAESGGYTDVLDDMATIYYTTHQFVKWVRENLVPDTGASIPIRTFATSITCNGSTRPFAADNAAFCRSPLGIFIGVDDSAYEKRENPSNHYPLNEEWHEFSHYLGYTYLLQQDCPGEVNHGGYSNASTCDSMKEGFAEFLPTQVEKNPDYAGIMNLEEHTKAWYLRFGSHGIVSSEDLAVASLLWDLVDSGADSEDTFDFDKYKGELLVKYTDNVSLTLPELWSVLTSSTPRTVYDLHNTLSFLPQFAALSQDLDLDMVPDISQVDSLFLMHGFYKFVIHNEPYYDVEEARLFNRPPNAFVGQTDHVSTFFMGWQTPSLEPRYSAPVNPNANLGLHMADTSGRTLHGGSVDLVVSYPNLPPTTLHRDLRDGVGVPLELPTYFQNLPTGDTLPDCDPNTDLVVDVTATGTMNGFPSSDVATFDNCTYIHALVGATGGSAMSFTLHFPEDSTPPVTTPDLHTLGVVTHGLASFADPVTWTQGGIWTVELPCADPLADGFASGCWRTEYSVDGGPFLAAPDEVTVAELGKHTLEYHSLDAAENAEATGTLQIGVLNAFPLGPPVTTLSLARTDPSDLQSPLQVTLTCRTDLTGNRPNEACKSEYTFENQLPFKPYTGPFVVSGVGEHVMQYRSYDLGGLYEEVRDADLIIPTADTTPPFTQLDYHADAPSILQPTVAMGSFVVTLVCSDGGPALQYHSGCVQTEYSLDGAAFQQYTGPVTVTQVGVHAFRYYSTDASGNQEATKQWDDLQVVPAQDSDGDGLLDFVDNCSQVFNPDQRDSDGDRFGDRCDPDFNQNGTVDSNDASVLKAKLGSPASAAPGLDLDNSGVIDANDLKILTGMFRKPPGPAYGYTWDLLKPGD